MRNRVAGAIVAAALLGAAAPSFAQSAAPPSTSKAAGPAAGQADPTARARARFTEGVGLAKDDEWQKAYDAFLEAWTLKQHPQIALNLGRAELQIGKHRDASEHLRYCIDQNPPEHPDTELARKWLEEAKKKVVTLKITVEGAEAEVRIDGQSIGKSPLPPEVYIDPGKHTVGARSGARHVEVTNTYEAGWVRVMKLVPKEPAAGGPVATGTATAAPTASGSGGGARTGPNKGLVIGGAVLGGVMVVAGGIFVGLAASKASEAGGFGAWDKCYQEPFAGDRSDCPLLHTYHQEVAFYGNLSTGMFLGGLAVGGATLLYALGILPPGSGPKRSAMLVVPVIAPSSGGLSVTGQF